MSDYALEDRGDGLFAVRGDMSFETANRLLRASEDPFRRHASLQVDLAGVKRADSAGLALLLEWKAEARLRNAAIRFEHIPDSLLALARTSDVEELI